jgi:hypothetical protein
MFTGNVIDQKVVKLLELLVLVGSDTSVKENILGADMCGVARWHIFKPKIPILGEF